MASKRQRFEAFKRDKFTCQYCGRRPPDVMLEADHIVPVSKGGPDTIENLTTSCTDCNRGKAAIGLGNVAPAIAREPLLAEQERLEALQEMLERKADIQARIDIATATRESEYEIACFIWDKAWDLGVRTELTSVRTFLRRGLSIDDLHRALELTLDQAQGNGGSEKYFYAICWKWIKDPALKDASVESALEPSRPRH